MVVEVLMWWMMLIACSGTPADTATVEGVVEAIGIDCDGSGEQPRAVVYVQGLNLEGADVLVNGVGTAQLAACGGGMYVGSPPSGADACDGVAAEVTTGATCYAVAYVGEPSTACEPVEVLPVADFPADCY